MQVRLWAAAAAAVEDFVMVRALVMAVGLLVAGCASSSGSGYAHHRQTVAFNLPDGRVAICDVGSMGAACAYSSVTTQRSR